MQTNSSAHASRFLVHFFDVHCKTSTWNHVMWRRFIQDVNIRRRIFLSFFEPWFTIILAWSSSLWRLVLSNRNIGQINYPSIAVQSALPSILSVIRSYTSVLLILNYTFPSCCLCKWFFQELFAKEFNSRKNLLHLTNWTGSTRGDKIWKDANSFFGDVFTTLVVVA